MSLPTAQLGQMPSLSMPSYIPTTVVQKEPKAWEKALLALVTNVGANIASHGVENLMQQDYADPAQGETPTTGVSRFFHGPTVDRAENDARKQALLKMQSELALRSLDSTPSARDVFMAREEEKRGMDANNAALRGQIAQLTLGQGGLQNQRDINAADIASREKLANAERSFHEPYEKAQVERLSSDTNRANAEAAKLEMARQIQERFMNGPDPKTGLTPRQQSVQTRAESMPLPSTGPTNIPQAVFQGYSVPSQLGDKIGDYLASADVEQTNPNDIARQILALRAQMPSQPQDVQHQTAVQISQLLSKLHEIASGQDRNPPPPQYHPMGLVP